MRTTRAFPIVISGPSGAGKTTLVERLVETDGQLRESVSTTTRPPRPGEVEGEAYFFLSEKDFTALQGRGGLIEWAEVHGHSYGTPRDFVERELAAGRDVVMNIDVQGGAAVKNCFPDSVMIFILPPTWAVLEQRIRSRGTDYAQEIERRLANARDEIDAASGYDYIVENDELAVAVADLQAIIRAERTRRDRYPEGYLGAFNLRP